jgi:hypothetical protein
MIAPSLFHLFYSEVVELVDVASLRHYYCPFKKMDSPEADLKYSIFNHQYSIEPTLPVPSMSDPAEFRAHVGTGQR